MDFISSLSCFPARNFGFFDAGISIDSPVRGFLPVFALVLATLKVPKPAILTSPPAFNVSVIISNKLSTALVASDLPTLFSLVLDLYVYCDIVYHYHDH